LLEEEKKRAIEEAKRPRRNTTDIIERYRKGVKLLENSAYRLAAHYKWDHDLKMVPLTKKLMQGIFVTKH